MLDGDARHPPLAVEIVGTFCYDIHEPRAVGTINRDTHVLEVLAIRVKHHVDRPRPVGLGVAEDYVVGTRGLGDVEPLVAELLRPLRDPRHVPLVNPRDKTRHCERDDEKRLHDREEPYAVRPHCDDLGVAAERPHGVKRRKHKRGGREILEERRKISAKIFYNDERRRFCVCEARKRSRELEKDVDRHEPAQTVKERDEKLSEDVSRQDSHDLDIIPYWRRPIVAWSLPIFLLTRSNSER